MYEKSQLGEHARIHIILQQTEFYILNNMSASRSSECENLVYKCENLVYKIVIQKEVLNKQKTTACCNTIIACIKDIMPPHACTHYYSYSTCNKKQTQSTWTGQLQCQMILSQPLEPQWFVVVVPNNSCPAYSVRYNTVITTQRQHTHKVQWRRITR